MDDNFNNDSIVNLLANDNYIIVNRSIIKEFGLKEAILLGELASEFNYYKKNNQLDENGFFYSTIDNVKNNTSLSVYEQKKCLDNLAKRNVINVVVKGIPATRYIKINSFILINLFANNLKTSLRETNKLDCEKLTPKNNKKNNKEDINKEIYKEKNFKKPTLSEVQAYCIERNNTVDAEYFIDYYESKGWLVGKTQMKDWKAAVRLWEKKNTKKIDKQKEFDEMCKRLAYLDEEE